MAGTVYGTSELLEVSRHIKISTPFWSNFFPRVILSDKEEIFFDVVDRDYRRLAPFVAPNVQGRPMTIGGYSSLSFKPAYVKPKHIVDVNMVIERRAGEALGTGSLSLSQRRDAVIADILYQHQVMLANRLEWMAARAVIDASVTISGEDYPARTVNFQRHASLTYTLLTTARWSVSTGAPLTDIDTARVNANNRSGAKITNLIFGATAWDYFKTRVDLRTIMDTTLGGYKANVQLRSDGYEGQEYMGTMSGSLGGGKLDLWVDTSKYVDETDTEQFYLDQKTVVGVSDLEGVQYFGAIKDFDADLKVMKFFQKMWREKDPSAEMILTQSSPLMVPKKPNASFKIITSD